MPGVMEAEHQRKQIKDLYPTLIAQFPGLNEQVEAYYTFIDQLQKERGTAAVDLTTDKETVIRCAEQLHKIAAIIAKGIRASDIDPVTLYIQVTKPAREARKKGSDPRQQVGLILERHIYFILERNRIDISNTTSPPRNNLLVMLQRIPRREDTGAEVHTQGGIEVYLPLEDDIEFHVNEQTFKPKRLSSIITILPGDVHHHKKESGTARVLLICGFGFSRGVKTTDTSYRVPTFDAIPRITNIEA